MKNLRRVNISEHVWGFGFGFAFDFFIVAEGGCPFPRLLVVLPWDVPIWGGTS